MAKKLDPRLNPVRPDLAGAELKGRVEAQRFAEARPAQVARGAVDLRRAPAADAPLDSQLLAGEAVGIYEVADGWAWVQSRADSYMGYAAADALREEQEAPSHWVKVPRTFVFPEPDEEAPPLDALSMTGRVRVTAEAGRFCELAGGGWVTGRHLAPLDTPAEDFVAVALQFMGVPYLWGGKTSQGLDCSGLVQVALAAAGIAAPRDSDMQAAGLGEARPLDAEPAHGDLIYLPSHVAIALDRWRVVHANAHEMLVSIEPLDELVARVTKKYGQGITAVRRPPEGAGA
ncbi:MAG: NlpC/P60 family protein [Kiloniellales bacterium]